MIGIESGLLWKIAKKSKNSFILTEEDPCLINLPATEWIATIAPAASVICKQPQDPLWKKSRHHLLFALETELAFPVDDLIPIKMKECVLLLTKEALHAQQSLFSRYKIPVHHVSSTALALLGYAAYLKQPNVRIIHKSLTGIDQVLIKNGQLVKSAFYPLNLFAEDQWEKLPQLLPADDESAYPLLLTGEFEGLSKEARFALPIGLVMRYEKHRWRENFLQEPYRATQWIPYFQSIAWKGVVVSLSCCLALSIYLNHSATSEMLMIEQALKAAPPVPQKNYGYPLAPSMSMLTTLNLLGSAAPEGVILMKCHWNAHKFPCKEHPTQKFEGTYTLHIEADTLIDAETFCKNIEKTFKGTSPSLDSDEKARRYCIKFEVKQ